MRRYRGSFRGMGADQTMQQLFDEQLASYKATLLALYRKKTQYASKRDVLRFQYLTGFRSKVQALFSAMTTQALKDGNSDGQALLQGILFWFQKNIPMTNLQGKPDPAWGQMLNYGGTWYAGFLSTNEQLMSLPFLEQPNNPESSYNSPAYKIYSTSGFLHSQNTVDFILQNYYPTPGRTNMSAPPTNEMRAKGLYQYQDYALPLTQDFVLGLADSGWISGAQSFRSQAAYVTQIINGSFNGVTLAGLLEQGRQLLSDIINNTKLLIQTQLEIDTASDQLKEFVDAYKDSIGATISIEQVLKDLEAAAQKAEAAPALEVPTGPTVVSSQPVPSADPVLVATTIPEQKSKLPFLIAAAVGIFAVTQGGKK